MEVNDSSTGTQLVKIIEPSPSLSFHPLFNFPDGDVVLQASDGLCFKVHKLILRLSSKFFESMLSLSPNIIQLEETCNTIQVALNIIYPDRVAEPIASLETALVLFEMAEKYQMKKVKEVTWASVSCKRFICSPLETFVLACKYGSEEEIQSASTATLEIDLYDARSAHLLCHLDGERKLQLHLFHIKRRQMLLSTFHISEYYSINNPDEKCMFVRICYSLRSGYTSLRGRVHTEECVAGFDHPSWNALKYLISVEMEKCSSGATIVAEEFWASPLIKDLWKLSCEHCRLPLFDKDGLIYETKRILKLLPSTIKDTLV